MVVVDEGQEGRVLSGLDERVMAGETICSRESDPDLEARAVGVGVHEAHVKRRHLSIAVLTIVALAVGYALGRSGPSIPGDPGTDAQALTEARVLFDDPVRSVLVLSYGVAAREEVPTAPTCERASGRRIVTTVNAYSLFGVVADRARIYCDGFSEVVGV